MTNMTHTGLKLIIVLVTCVLFSVPASGAPGASRSLGDIVTLLKARRAKVASIVVAYELRGATFDDRVLLLKQNILNLPNEDVTVAVMGPKIYQHRFSRVVNYGAVLSKLRKNNPKVPPNGSPSSMLNTVSPREFFEAIDNTPQMNEDKVLIYDGKILKETLPNEMNDNGVPRRVDKITEPKPTSEERYFAETYLDNVGFGIIDPCGGPASVVGCIDSIIAGADATIVTDAAEVSGNRCVLFAVGGHERVWLDANLGYAMRKREIFAADLLCDVECDDFVEVLPELWFPKTCIRRMFKGGRPFMKYEFRAVKVELNRPDHSIYFDMEPKPGTIVVNELISPIDSSGTASARGSSETDAITYIQPRDKKDLDQVIRDARVSYNEGIRKSKDKNKSWSVFLIANLVIAVSIGVRLAWIAARKRREGQNRKA